MHVIHATVTKVGEQKYWSEWDRKSWEYNFISAKDNGQNEENATYSLGW